MLSVLEDWGPGRWLCMQNWLGVGQGCKHQSENRCFWSAFFSCGSGSSRMRSWIHDFVFYSSVSDSHNILLLGPDPHSKCGSGCRIFNLHKLLRILSCFSKIKTSTSSFSVNDNKNKEFRYIHN
jgi:hypothetical protein